MKSSMKISARLALVSAVLIAAVPAVTHAHFKLLEPASWLEQDLSAARDLQRTFLPEPVLKNSAGIKVVTEYVPAFT